MGYFVYEWLLGSYQYDEKDELWYGHLMNIPYRMHYEGRTREEIQRAFEEAAAEYLHFIYAA